MNAVDALDRSPAHEAVAAREQAEAANAHEGRRRRAYWFVGVAAFGMIGLLLLAGALVERLTFYSPIAATKARLEEDGLPTTWEGARAEAPRPPEKLDATPAWTEFRKRFPLPTSFDPLKFDEGEKASAAWRTELRALADSGGYRFTEYDRRRLIDDDYMVVLRELDIEQSAHRFLVERARLLHDRGDVDEAADSLALSLATVRNAKYEPFLVCRLAAAARLRESCRGIEELLRGGELSPERWAEFQAALGRCDLRDGYDSMRLHETTIQMDYVERSDMGELNMNFVQRWYARRELADQLDSTDRLRRAHALPLAERLRELAAVDVVSDEASQRVVGYLGPALGKNIVGDFRSANVLQELASLETESLRRTLMAAIACRRFELAEDRLPESWDDLAPYDVDEAPASAWTGDPMTLVRRDDGSVSIEAPWPTEALKAADEVSNVDWRYDAAAPFQGIALDPRTNGGRQSEDGTD